MYTNGTKVKVSSPMSDDIWKKSFLGVVDRFDIKQNKYAIVDVKTKTCYMVPPIKLNLFNIEITM